MYDHDEKGLGLVKITVLVVVILILVVIFQFCLPRAATESIISIALRSENEIDKLAAMGDSSCKLELITVKVPDDRSNPLAYGEMWVPVSRKSLQWKKELDTGDCILLPASRSSKQIKVRASDLDVQFLPLLASSKQWPPNENLLPKSFRQYLRAYTGYSSLGCTYRVKGLKPSQTVTAVGRLEKSDNQIWLRPFNASGSLHSVIVTTLPSAELNRYLHANYPIGKSLGHALGIASDVETDPSIVGIPAE